MFKNILQFQRKNQVFSLLAKLQAFQSSLSTNFNAFTSAQCFFRQGNYKRAQEKLDEIKVSKGNDIDALKLYAKVLVAQEQFSEGLKAFQRVIEISPGDIESNISQMGLIETINEGDNSEVLDDITDRIIKHHPEDEGQKVAVAFTSLIDEQYDEIINVLKDPAEFADENNRFLACSLLKEAYQYKNEPQKAIEVLEKSAELCTEKLDDIYFELAKLYHSEGKYNEEQIVLEKSLAFNPNQFDVLIELAWMYYMKGNKSKVDECMQKSEAIEKFNSKAYFYRAKMLQQENQLDAAEKMLLEAVKIEGKNTSCQIFNQLGVLALQRQEIQKAQNHFMEALEKNNEEHQYYFNIALTHRLLKNPLAAIDYLERGLILKPQHIGALSMLGKLYLQNRKIKEAVQTLEKAVQIDSSKDNTELLFDLANAYTQENDLKNAKQMIEKVLDIDPNHKEALNLKANMGVM